MSKNYSNILRVQPQNSITINPITTIFSQTIWVLRIFDSETFVVPLKSGYNLWLDIY